MSSSLDRVNGSEDNHGENVKPEDQNQARVDIGKGGRKDERPKKDLGDQSPFENRKVDDVEETRDS